MEEKSWKEFRDSGLLWAINTVLHMFGWSVVCEFDENGDISRCYPARVKYRGFSEITNTTGYIKISEYLKDNIEDILKESKGE